MQLQCFRVGLICSFFLSPTIFFFYSFHVLVCGAGVFGLIECSHSLPALHRSYILIIIMWYRTAKFPAKRNIHFALNINNLFYNDELGPL